LHAQDMNARPSQEVEMDAPEEFKTLMAQLASSSLGQAYADIGCTRVEFFLSCHGNRQAVKRLDDYLAYVLAHPDRRDKASALWKQLDTYGKFGGVNKPLALFEEMRREIARQLDAPG